jgi:pyrroloquinoline quinone (PQQ) biosynthesis protein C
MPSTTKRASSVLGPDLTRQRIFDLVDGLSCHEALDNDFYHRWVAGPLPHPEITVFAEQYMARTMNTSVMVALSVLNTADLNARVECVKNLYSEYGNGDASKAHLVLLENFFTDLLSRLLDLPVLPEQIHSADPLPSTVAFSSGQRKLFTSEDQRTVQGALLAQEHLAYSMLTRLYEGVRNYKYAYRTDDEFHEACEYFYIHIGEAEKEHKREAVNSTVAVCSSETDIEVAASAFRKFADLTADYWAGVNTAMLKAV